MLDATDKNILTVLQTEGVMTNLQLAKTIDLSPAATLARVKKLEQLAVIKDYRVIIDVEQLGYNLQCFIQVSLAHHDASLVEEFRNAIKAMPEVLECYFLTGMSDYLLKVVAQDTKGLERFLVNTLTPAPGVERLQTSLILNEVKMQTVLEAK